MSIFRANNKGPDDIDTKKVKRKKYKNLPRVILVMISIGAMAYFANTLNCSLLDVIRLIYSNLFFKPHPNGFYADDYSVYLFVYLLLALLMVSSSILSSLTIRMTKWESDKKESRDKRDYFCLMIAVFLIVVAGQTWQHGKYFLHLYRTFNGKTSKEKKTMIFGSLYNFASECQKSLPGKFKGEIITDIDLMGKVGATEQRALAYHLYPLQIKFVPRDYKPDFLIYYRKKNAAANIPEDYVVKYQFNAQNLLAVRKDL